MITRELGRTGEFVAAVGQGLTRTGASASREVDDNRVRVIRRGIELGMNLIDTAELYGGGHGEDVAGRAVSGIRDQVFLTGKFNPGHADRKGLIAAAERTLKRLGTDYLDLYQVHWPNSSVPYEETFRAMEQLVVQGKVRYLGVCNYTVGQLEEVRMSVPDVTICAAQSEYNLYQRHVELNLLPYCASEGITMIAYSPLDSGADAFGDSRLKTLGRIASEHGLTWQQLAIRWLLARERVVVAVRSSTIEHVEDNAACVEIDISETDIQAIDELFAQKVFKIPPREVAVLRTDGYTYETVEEAAANESDLIPSPRSVADNLASGHLIQPVGLRELRDSNGDVRYALADNERLFWAWRIERNDDPIPAYVKHPAERRDFG